jgi:hypothetical protein
LLAFIEHGFLVVPWQDTALFRWAMRNRHATGRQASGNSRPDVTDHQQSTLAAMETVRQ